MAGSSPPFFYPCLTGKEKVLSKATGTPNFIFRMVDPGPGRQQWHCAAALPPSVFSQVESADD
jgi:hypothetical protein